MTEEVDRNHETPFISFQQSTLLFGCLEYYCPKLPVRELYMLKNSRIGSGWITIT
jgi:hypothetical protein